MSFILSIWANNGNCPIKLCNRTSIAHWRKYSWQLIFMIFHLGLKAVVGLYRRISTGNFSTKDTSIHLLHPHLFHVPPNSTVSLPPFQQSKAAKAPIIDSPMVHFSIEFIDGVLIDSLVLYGHFAPILCTLHKFTEINLKGWVVNLLPSLPLNPAFTVSKGEQFTISDINPKTIAKV